MCLQTSKKYEINKNSIVASKLLRFGSDTFLFLLIHQNNWLHVCAQEETLQAFRPIRNHNEKSRHRNFITSRNTSAFPMIAQSILSHLHHVNADSLSLFFHENDKTKNSAAGTMRRRNIKMSKDGWQKYFYFHVHHRNLAYTEIKSHRIDSRKTFPHRNILYQIFIVNCLFFERFGRPTFATNSFPFSTWRNDSQLETHRKVQQDFFYFIVLLRILFLLFPIFFLLFSRPVLFACYNKISPVIGFSYRGFHFTHSFRARAHIERQTRIISNSLVVPTRTCSQEKLCFSFIFEIFSWGRRRKFPQHVFHVISLVQTAVARDSFRLEIR